MAGILLAALIVYSLCLLLPLCYGLMFSLKTNDDYTNHPIGFPNPLYFQNYIKAFEGFFVTIYNSNRVYDVFLERMFLNSTLYALGCSFMSAAVPCIAAYVVANYKYKICKAIYGFVIVSMILPIVGSLPSELQLAKTLGLYDNFLGLWIMSGISGACIFWFFSPLSSRFRKTMPRPLKLTAAGLSLCFSASCCHWREMCFSP